MQNIPYAERIARAKAASIAAVQALKTRQDPYKHKYGDGFKQLLRLGATIKQRCTNPNNLAFSNCGWGVIS